MSEQWVVRLPDGRYVERIVSMWHDGMIATWRSSIYRQNAQRFTEGRALLVASQLDGAAEPQVTAPHTPHTR